MPATHSIQHKVSQEALHASRRELSPAAMNHRSKHIFAARFQLCLTPKERCGKHAVKATLFDSLGELSLDIEE